MLEHRKWCEYLKSLSVEELEMQKTQLELEVQGNGEMAESKRLGLLPYGAEQEDYEHEAEEAQWRLEFVKKFLRLHTWANSMIGKTLGRGGRTRIIRSYYTSYKATGAYFLCHACSYPTYLLVPEGEKEDARY